MERAGRTPRSGGRPEAVYRRPPGHRAGPYACAAPTETCESAGLRQSAGSASLTGDGSAAFSSTSANCPNSSPRNATSGLPWSPAESTSAPLPCWPRANAPVPASHSPPSTNAGRAPEAHEYEMLVYPETVKIAQLITRTSFKDWIQNPAHPAGQRRDRVASEIARTISRTSESHRRRTAQRIENALRRALPSRHRVARLRPSPPTPRALQPLTELTA